MQFKAMGCVVISHTPAGMCYIESTSAVICSQFFFFLPFVHIWSFSSIYLCLNSTPMGCPGGSDSNESACNAGDLGSIPGLGRSPGEGNGNPLQYSCLENPMDGGAWWATVHGSQRVGHDWATSLSLPALPLLIIVLPTTKTSKIALLARASRGH